MSGITKYHIAQGEDGFKKVLAEIWQESRKEPLVDYKQYDILYAIGSLVALIKIDLNKDVKVLYEDIVSPSRQAPLPVRKAIATFLQAERIDRILETTAGEIVLSPADQNVLGKQFLVPGYQANVDRQEKAGFFSGGRMNIDGYTAADYDEGDVTAIKSLMQNISPVIHLTADSAALLLQSQKKLDALVQPSRATEYAAGGKHKATLFADGDKLVSTEPAAEVNAKRKFKK